MDTIHLSDDHLLWQYDDHILRIDAWGENSLRVRATKAARIDTAQDWALLPPGDAALMKPRDAPATLIAARRLSASSNRPPMAFV